MRRVVIAAAAAAVLAAAGCSGDEEPETPDVEGSQPDSVADEWESKGELDYMPAEAAADLEPLIAPETIVDAFADAGLSDGESTDLGTEEEDCDLTDCVRAFSTGEVTVMLYMGDEQASAAAAQFGDAHVEGTVVLHYAASETPEDARGDYETALADALAE